MIAIFLPPGILGFPHSSFQERGGGEGSSPPLRGTTWTQSEPVCRVANASGRSVQLCFGSLVLAAVKAAATKEASEFFRLFFPKYRSG